MTPIFISALSLGLLGSLHCLGMCGPLAMLVAERKPGKLWPMVVYNIGRALTYAAMGALLGLLGQGLHLGNFQRTTSIAMGIILLIYVILSWLPVGSFLHKTPSFLAEASRKLMGKALKNRSSFLIIGMVNGLLPCGLVYVALSTALLAGNVAGGALAMFIFGLGTIPMMMLAPSLIQKLLARHRSKVKKLVPWVLTALAVLLILRGADLGIPFISPQLGASGGAPSCH